MTTALVTGSCGLVGSAVTSLLVEKGLHVIGVDNDMRGNIFGDSASTRPVRKQMIEKFGELYEHEDADIRDTHWMHSIFNTRDLDLIIHTAGQPSHDWSAQAPMVDFDINARATLALLQSTRNWAHESVFVYLSTNKVYGDWVNTLTYQETPTRWEPTYGSLAEYGVTETAPVDGYMHSPFGVSKLSADLMVQEYGRYFDMPTVCFRCGCITGGEHRGVGLHGFLAYLARCLKNGMPYNVLGYGGKQVRDNIHADDLARAIWEFYQDPKVAAVYNMGGGYENSCSILEAIRDMQELSGRRLSYDISPTTRKGDHRWWISSTFKFQGDYPSWDIEIGLSDIYKELVGVT